MPRIPEAALQSVFYLYRSKQDAIAGERNGGTGFFVSVQRSDQSPSFLYAFSNWHVVGPDPLGEATVARVNLEHGGLEVFEDLCWTQHPDGDDLAMARLDVTKSFDVGTIRSLMCLEAVDSLKVQGKNPDNEPTSILGPGNDVFFVGRYADHEGREKNYPVVRFGNIAMMPGEPIWNKALMINQESFIVEARSFGGFSGSPVLVDAHQFIDDDGVPNFYMMVPIRLLGVVWGHKAMFKRVLESDKETPVHNEQWVEENSGLVYVVPAWKMLDMLMAEEQVALREKRLAEVDEENKGKGLGISPDALDGDEPRITQEEFSDALRKGDTPDCP